MAKGAYVGTLERFGYTMTCVGKTEKDVVASIMKCYDESYRHNNGGLDPKKAHSYGEESDYDVARGDVYVRFLEYGEVEWD